MMDWNRGLPGRPIITGRKRHFATGDKSHEGGLAQMEDAIIRLGNFERSIFLGRCADRMSYAELAESLGVSVGFVKRAMVGALINLDRNLVNPRRCWWRRWLR